MCIRDRKNLHKSTGSKATKAISKIQSAAVSGGNIFEEIIEAGKVASLGEITNAMFQVGGAYRRNM